MNTGSFFKKNFVSIRNVCTFALRKQENWNLNNIYKQLVSSK